MVIAVPLGVGDGVVHQRVRAGAAAAGPHVDGRPARRAAEPALRHLGLVRAADAPRAGRELPRRTTSRSLPFLQRPTRVDAVVGSSFIAGVVVAIMIMPIITSVSRDVMAQVPREQCEGALALGRDALGDDPRRHPAVRPRRHRRRVAARLRPGARRDDRGRADHQPASIDVNTHILQDGRVRRSRRTSRSTSARRRRSNAAASSRPGSRSSS